MTAFVVPGTGKDKVPAGGGNPALWSAEEPETTADTNAGTKGKERGKDTVVRDAQKIFLLHDMFENFIENCSGNT